MHRTWRSKELRCQSNKYQAASEAGKLEVFALLKASFFASTHVVDAIVLSILILEMQKCCQNSHMHRTVLNVFFYRKTSSTMAKSLCPKHNR